ncbi:ABC transporter substrate-binding protein [Phytoactinopolyspora endophytica]|uniref:ABC transporter substrate-binding protein n=1 Tax=Phytoactinopolyspora endophytica TaxID=1642495 RepID=UPI00101CA136|nr:ABC transporter substrate-binding protein [Phytoactinopolyspora endophytica]
MTRQTHPTRVGTLAAVGVLGVLSLVACGTDDGTTTSTGDTPSDADQEASDSAGSPGGDGTDGADGTDWPVTVDNCGVEITVDEPPQRAVSLNKPVTEILLALGLRDRIAGVAGEPDETVAAEVADDFAAVDVLVDKDYPSFEALIDTLPDFIYASYPSAYRDDGVGSRDTLADFGIPTYLSSGRCEDRPEDEPITIEDVWSEIEEIGHIFGASDAAESLVMEQRALFDETLASLEDLPARSVFWWDMKTDTPFVGACCGAPAMLIDSLGFENIFEDLPGHWADASWEQVVERDPDLIVIADFGDGDIDEKLDFITSDPTLSRLRAVQDGAMVTLPFAMTTPGIQTVDALGTLAEASTRLADADE